jgi:hypothetical protein
MNQPTSVVRRRAASVPGQCRTQSLDSPAAAAFASYAPTARVVSPVRVRRLLAIGRELVVITALLCATAVMQLEYGALQGERASQSDEAGHFMNGLVLRDYLRDGLGENPLTFAERYYLSYPKIAIGMWPPLFHTVLGLFMLASWPPQIAAIVLVALVNTWAGWRLYRIVTLFDTKLVGLLIAATFVGATANMGLTTAIMLDLPVAALTLEATYWLALFFVTGSRRHATVFGLFAALCCLTKGNGLAIILVPIILIALTRRPDLLRQPGLYIAAAIVLVFAGPFVAISFHLDRAIGDFGWLSASDALGRAGYYSSYLWTQLGAPVILLSAMALIGSARRSAIGSPTLDSNVKSALAALAFAALAFHILNPHMSIATRYVSMAVAPLLGLVPVGADAVSRMIRQQKLRRPAQLALVTAAVIVAFLSAPAATKRVPIGARQTVDFLETHGGLSDLSVLVISNEPGEGAMVSEVALRHPVPAATVMRGTKLVATDDWSGHHFKMLFASAGDLLRRLEDLHVAYLVMDYSPGAKAIPFWGQVDEVITSYPDRVEQVFQTTTARRFVVYRLKYRSPGPRKPLEVPLKYSLGRILSK